MSNRVVDFGPAVFLHSKYTKLSNILVCPAAEVVVDSNGDLESSAESIDEYFYIFYKKSEKCLKSGKLSLYYECGRCRGQRSPGRKGRVTVQDDRLTSDPSLGHHPQCRPYPKSYVDELKRGLELEIGDLNSEEAYGKDELAGDELTDDSSSTTEFKKKLIDQIRQNEILWNSKCSTYKDKQAKELAWAYVAYNLGNSAEKCKEIYKHLRQRYARIRLDMELSQEKGHWTKKWEFFDQMSFVDQVCYPRRNSRGRKRQQKPDNFTTSTLSGTAEQGQRSSTVHAYESEPISNVILFTDQSEDSSAIIDQSNSSAIAVVAADCTTTSEIVGPSYSNDDDIVNSDHSSQLVNYDRGQLKLSKSIGGNKRKFVPSIRFKNDQFPKSTAEKHPKNLHRTIRRPYSNAQDDELEIFGKSVSLKLRRVAPQLRDDCMEAVDQVLRIYLKRKVPNKDADEFEL